MVLQGLLNEERAKHVPSHDLSPFFFGDGSARLFVQHFKAFSEMKKSVGECLQTILRLISLPIVVKLLLAVCFQYLFCSFSKWLKNVWI